MSTKDLDSLLIAQYIEGKLDSKKMYELEKQALNDPFLWEALEGYEQTQNPRTELSILQRQLHERIVHLQENKKVFDSTWQRLSVAASASVLFIAAGILFWLNINRPASSVNQKQVEVSLIHHDSIRHEIRAYGGLSADGKNLETVPSESVENADSNSSNNLSGSISTASSQGVQPITGWDIYRQYLEDNMRRPAVDPKSKGSVLLSFRVDETGKATELRVLKGLGEAYNMEAIRLVKEGPLWKTRAGSKTVVGRVEIVF